MSEYLEEHVQSVSQFFDIEKRLILINVKYVYVILYSIVKFYERNLMNLMNISTKINKTF